VRRTSTVASCNLQRQRRARRGRCSPQPQHGTGFPASDPMGRVFRSVLTQLNRCDGTVKFVWDAAIFGCSRESVDSRLSCRGQHGDLIPHLKSDASRHGDRWRSRGCRHSQAQPASLPAKTPSITVGGRVRVDSIVKTETRPVVTPKPLHCIVSREIRCERLAPPGRGRCLHTLTSNGSSVSSARHTAKSGRRNSYPHAQD
jgi:hypothetical protein